MTCFLGFPIHLGKHGRIEIALVKRDFAAAHDRRHNAGEGFDATMVQTASSCFLAIVRISNASLAAAARASRRAFIGVEPECASGRET